jgi:hypothetical protein
VFAGIEWSSVKESMKSKLLKQDFDMEKTAGTEFHVYLKEY